MQGQTSNQTYHLILADIAMSAAIRVHDEGYAIEADEHSYQPGSIRDHWIASTSDRLLARRVMSMASAGLASLQSLGGPELALAAQTYGVPLDKETALSIAEHFVNKRNAVLTYRR